MSLRTNYESITYVCTVAAPPGVGPPASDVGALGVIGGGDRRRVGAPLFGVVEAVVVLVGGGGGGGGGVRGAAGQDGAGQQGEDGAHPAHVQGEAEGHDAVLAVGADGEPHGGNQAARSCGDQASTVGASRQFKRG